MKKILIITSIFVTLFSLSSFAYAVKTFIVEKGGSNKVLITDGTSEYVIEHDYNCSDSDFYDGTTVYIDTSYSPSYGDKIIISGYSDTVCEVTSVEDVNIRKYYVDKVLDSEDKIIVTDKNSNQLLVEYGIGCGISMWRYEGKTVDIDIGGSFLDGIGDRMYLFDSDRDCKIWDAEEISSSGSSYYVPSTTYIPPVSTPTSCPSNSSLTATGCVCNSGYITDSTKAYCVVKPLTTISCPANASNVGGNCKCNAGYTASGSLCITDTQSCQNQYGTNSYGDAQNCYCSTGYEWTTDKKSCVIKSVPVVVNIEPAPTCNISFTPKIVEVGKNYTILYKTTGQITSASMKGTGDSSHYNGILWNIDANMVKGFISGYFPMEQRANNVGESSLILTVIGPSGSSTCTSSYTVIPKSTLKDSSKDINSKEIKKETTKDKKNYFDSIVLPKEEVVPIVNPEPVKKVRWYQKIFNWLF